MQIAYSEFDLKVVLDTFAMGFKAAKGDKVIRTEPFLDVAQGKVLYRIYIQKSGEDEPSPLIVLPDDKA